MKTIAVIFLASAAFVAGSSAFAGTGSLQMTHYQKAHTQKVSVATQETMAGATGPIGKIGPGTEPAVSKRSPSVHR
jgi:hypothetical protein